MSLALHHMDFIFQTKIGTYALDSQCEMLAEAGYQGITVSAWSQELSLLPKVKERWDIDVASMYLIYRPGLEKFVTDIFDSIEGVSRIELALHSGSKIEDADRHLLAQLLPICEQRGIEIALYPHIRYGMQSTTEAVMLCREFQHDKLGIVFNGYHWFAMQEKRLEQRLDAVWPWIKQVNMAGCSLSPLGWGGVATIEPLDSGEMDNFVLLGSLKQRNYEGRIGVLGWEGMGGDVYGNLVRSQLAFRKMELRVNIHPEWAKMIITN